MPLKKGRLKPEDDCKIRKNYEFLKDNFDPVNGALDHMIGDLVFDLHDQDYVKNGGETTAQGRVERFIERLQNSGPDGYQKFIAALEASGDEHLAKVLEETEVPESNKKDPFAWIEELPDSVKNQCPNEADGSRLSGALGKGWEHVFMQLGVSSVKIEQAVMSNTHSVSVAIAFLINRWKQRNGSNAKFIVLLNALKNAEAQCTIDWEVVEKVVKDRCKDGACA